jgi:beta-mannanase
MDFNQKFEPKGNKILHGAGQSPETFSNYWNAVEKTKPLIYMTYIKMTKITEWTNRIKKELDKYPNLIPQIGLNLLDLKKNDISLEVSNGEYDKDLEKLLSKLKSLDRPVFIRIGYEFDKKDKYDPDNFVKAWRHIVDKLRDAKIENVATVWCACPFNGTDPVEPFYPGDDYVDWFGVDVFPTRWLTGEYKPVEDFLALANKKKKPVMVGESTAAYTGVLEGKKSWEEWFKPFFKWIHNHKQIKAFCYINWDWAVDKTWGSPGTWGNCRIEDNKEVKERFVRELKNPKYIHNQPIIELLEKINS